MPFSTSYSLTLSKSKLFSTAKNLSTKIFVSFLFSEISESKKALKPIKIFHLHERTQRLFTGSTIARREVFSAGS